MCNIIVSIKHFEWFEEKIGSHFETPDFGGKWEVNGNIFKKLWNILHFKHLIICREVSIKHFEWFLEKIGSHFKIPNFGVNGR
jgi:hypothetical protein